MSVKHCQKKRLLLVQITTARMFKRWLNCCGDKKKELMYKGKMLLRFKRRFNFIYNNVFDQLDEYYKNNAKFEYKRMSGGIYRGRNVLMTYWSHKAEQCDSRVRHPFNMLEHKRVEFVFTGKIIIDKNIWYTQTLKKLERIQKQSAWFAKLFDITLEELDKMGALGKRPFDINDCWKRSYE